MPTTLKIFDYMPDLDCFVNTHYRAIAEQLGLTGWHAAKFVSEKEPF